jgi:hypothetical protein
MRTEAVQLRMRASPLGQAGNIRGRAPAIRVGAGVFPGRRREAGDAREFSADAAEQFWDGRSAAAAMVAKSRDKRRASGAGGRADSGGSVAFVAAPRGGREDRQAGRPGRRAPVEAASDNVVASGAAEIFCFTTAGAAL